MPCPPIPDAAFALLLDLDGSILDLASTPDQIDIPPSLLGVLCSLHLQLDGALACISGRSYADLSAWLGCTNIDLAGSHGAEIGQLQEPHSYWRLCGLQCSSFLHVHWPQTVVEIKPHGIAIHWRQCLQAESSIRAWISHHQHSWPPHTCIDGKCVVEIYAGNCNKGDAVSHFMRQPGYVGKRPIYVGDDTTDLAAFAAVQALGGWRIAVGEKIASAADFVLPNPHSCRQWLQEMHESLQNHTIRSALKPL